MIDPESGPLLQANHKRQHHCYQERRASSSTSYGFSPVPRRNLPGCLNTSVVNNFSCQQPWLSATGKIICSSIVHRPWSISTFHPSNLPSFHSSTLAFVPPKIKFKKQIGTNPLAPIYIHIPPTPPTYTAPGYEKAPIESLLLRFVPKQLNAHPSRRTS